MLIVEKGIKEMIHVSNFQIYTSYHVSIAQTILSHLQTGTVSIENNIDKVETSLCPMHREDLEILQCN